MDAGMWTVMVFGMLAMVVALVAVAWLIVRPLERWSTAKANRDPALEELRLRYARGEVSPEELQERRRALKRP
jgi:putative membrane protein